MNLKPLLISVCFLPLILPVQAGVKTIDNTSVQIYDPFIFNSTDQSIWDTTTEQNDTQNFKWELSKKDWQKFIGPITNKISVGKVIEKCALGICGKVGAEAGLELESYFLPYFEAVLQPGTFNAAAEFQPEIQYQSSGLGVDFTSLDTKSGLQQGPQTSLLLRAPSIEVDAGLTIENELSLFAEACLVDCILDETFPIYNNEFKLPLLEINTKMDPTTGEKPVIKVFNPPNEPEDFVNALITVGEELKENPDASIVDVLGGVFYSDFSEIIWDGAEDKYAELFDEDVKNATNAEQRADAQKKSADSLALTVADKKTSLAQSPLSASVSNPFLEDVKSEEGSLSAQIGGQLAEITLDVDQLLGLAVGLPNGGSLSLSQAEIPTSVLSGELTLGDVKIGPVFDLYTDVSVTPELMVHLKFDDQVLIKGEIGKQDSYTGTWENLPDIALLAPEGPLTFDPKQDSIGTYFKENASSVSATPQFFVEATVKNETYLEVNATAKIELFSAEISIPGVGTKKIPPVWSKEVNTLSPLASVDLYANSFGDNDWFVLKDGEVSTRYTPTARAYLVADGIDDIDNNPTNGDLSFSAGGEVVFQARRKAGISQVPEVAGSDPRVSSFLSTTGLTNINSNIRFDGRNHFDESVLQPDPDDEDRNHDVNRNDEAYLRLVQEYFPFSNVYDVTNNSVSDALHQRLQIEPGQMAQVMRDGRLRIDNDFTIEVGGVLELGAEPTIVSGFLEKDLGVVNIADNTFTVHGTVYSQGSAEKQALAGQSGSISDAHAFINEGTLDIGYTGSVKTDGAFSNRGNITNHGALEFTSTDAQSTGSIYNGHGGEIDVYGSLALYNAQNRASMSVNTGGSLLLSDVGGNSADAKLYNHGELAIDKGGLLQISSDTNQGYLLQNKFIVENKGFLHNQAGGNIVNGKQGYDWSQWLEASDVIGTAREQRSDAHNEALNNADSQLEEQNLTVLSTVANAEIKRQQFISAGNDAVSAVESNLLNASTVIAELIDDVWLKSKAYDTAVAASDACSEYFECLILNVAKQTEKRNLDDARGVLTWTKNVVLGVTAGLPSTLSTHDAQVKEKAFGLALDAVASEREKLAKLLTTIDVASYQQSENGFGLIKNSSGALLVNESTLTNYGVVENDFNAALYNEGELNNDGLLRNNGEFVNQSNATLTNTGYISNGLAEVGAAGFSQLFNLGAIDNQGVLLNQDTLVNYGTLVNQAASGGQSIAGVVYNTGQLDNIGSITNNGVMVNYVEAGLNNHGLLVNNGQMTNLGTFTNGAHAILEEGQSALSVGNFLQLANAVYSAHQRTAETGVLLPRLQEEFNDNRARARMLSQAGVGAWRICLDYPDGTPVPAGTPGCLDDYERQVQPVLDQRKDALDYYAGLEVDLLSKIDAAEDIMAQTTAALDASLLDSASVANLENNGVFNNIGILNNVGTITNNATGELRNSGIVMVGEGAIIDNKGTLSVESDKSLSQEGMLFSNGTIDNSGMLDISAGTLVNGTPKTPGALINNYGTIALSGKVTRLNPDSTPPELLFESASLVNHGRLQNHAGGVLEIGAENESLQSLVNMLVNYGTIANMDSARITNHGLLYNEGLIDNQAGSAFENYGELNNAGDIQFAKDSTLNGRVINNGFITMADDELLTLTGNISGNGTFAGDTLIRGAGAGAGDNERAIVNPGNSPGLLTFDGNVESAENVNWVMEIWGDERGVSYDGVDILGNFTLLADMSITILSILDFDELLGADFTFLSIAGNLLDNRGRAYTGTPSFTGLSDISEGWAGTWLRNLNNTGWNLNFAFASGAGAEQAYVDYSDNINQYSQLASQRTAINTTAVPTPATLYIFLLGLGLLGWSRRRRVHCAVQ
jgi:hypothetical protein